MVDKRGFWFIGLGLIGLLFMIFGTEVFDMNNFDILLVFLTLFTFVLIFIGFSVLVLTMEYTKRKRIGTLYFLIALCILLTGWYFKKQHWPGAGPLLIIAIFFFVFSFLPVKIKNRYDKLKVLTDSTLVLIILCTGDMIGFGALPLGYLFRIQHWPGGFAIMYIGAIMVLITLIGWNYLFRQVVKQRKEAEIKLADAYKDLNAKHALLEEKQKEIIDSIRYARRIQKALLPSDKFIERQLKKN